MKEASPPPPPAWTAALGPARAVGSAWGCEGKTAPSLVLGTVLYRFSRAWTAGGGVDKTPCLRWGRGGREGLGG